MAGHEAQPSLLQPSLLQGFPARAQVSGPPLAAVNPVARVILESSLPHLDRPFDYSVPAELAEAAAPGVRVKVKFNGQELNGFIVERRDDSDAAHPLTPLHKVVSPVAVLVPAVSRLAGTVAARYAGTLSDVLRTAVPPRVAKVEKELLAGDFDADAVDLKPFTDAHAWAAYSNGASFLQHLASGGSPKAVLTALQGFGPEGWPALIASAVATVRSSGRGAVVVVPDYRDLEQLEAALTQVLPASDVARLTADDGQTPRYRNFLRLLSGSAGVAIGTRSAAYAPVRDLGLVVCWDDGDDLHIEQRAPYAHTREVLLLRAEQEGSACLMAAHSRSTELQRLVEMQWAVPLDAPRTAVRSTVPRVLNTADSFEQERDPLARIARLPGAAWRAAKEGLERGPVLVQVARAGYAPSLVCETCRELARCNACQGPLAVSSSSAVPSCRWCSTPAPQWRCTHCSGTRLRRGAAGVMRTAEELGRAFPGASVVTSSGEHIKATVPDSPALVVATVGAEPVAPHGYAAALLLDGNSLLRRENLRAGEDTVRRWFNAAALVKPASQGGLVVITADDTTATGALLRWDAPGYASRELALRKELQLPPAVRVASVTGSRADVGLFSDAFEASAGAVTGTKLRKAGPAPVQLYSGPGSSGEAEADVRTLYFIPYTDAAETTRALRAVKVASAAKRTSGPVQLRLDGVDVL
ncbi:replication restart DNA helicase PriA [Arthrobacter sp. yr096]|uniref:primosomal protein N' n=1 Tax=unclassified Arthrobacter TaxID=235627 RepID=UPI00089BB1B5|nr:MULTISPECIES: primosomal protein N' [unclassified Arthrobacter]SDW49909.1 replication restart DNA helicase PriA [Arthrobacter sp. cf158]SEJ07000.1 replication restart DNA helicase PriA [Arthrobacter sp. yr096]